MTTQDHNTLHSFLVKQTSIESETVFRMFELMNDNYNNMSFETFQNDLSKKQWVTLLCDTDDLVQGFTTYAVNPSDVGTEEYNVLFSGDTIISPSYWGTQELMRSWCTAVGRIISSSPNKKWYWYLLSKGHRTYMYLPLFFKTYYPSQETETDQTFLNLVNECSSKLFPKHWKADKGLIVFDNQAGELKMELAEGTFEKKKNPRIAYFLEKNPEFFKGHELVCLAQIHPQNFQDRARKHVEEGMKNPIQ